MNRRPACVLLAALGVLAAAANLRDAKAASPEIVGVRVGIAGRYKAGLWTPVEVRLRGANGGADRVVLTVRDGDGVPSRFQAPLASRVAAAEPTDRGEGVVSFFVRFGRVRSELLIEVCEGERVCAERVFRAGPGGDYPVALRSDQRLLVTVGRAPLGVEQAVRRLREAPGEETVVVAIDDLNELPGAWHGYEGVEAVVLATSDPSIYAGPTPGGRHMAALDDWVRNGGRLLLCLGREAEALLRADSNAAIGDFAPGRFERMIPLSASRTTALESYCGCSVGIPRARDQVPIPYFVDVEGKVELRDGPVPLVIRSPRGLGQVLVATFDPDGPPLDRWEERGLLMGTLLGLARPGDDRPGEGTAVMHFGYRDLAGQLRSALDQFSGVRVVPFWLVAGLILVYSLLIGLGDYFLVHRILRREGLTWITFPLAVVAFSAIAYLLADRFRGDAVLANQVDLIDVDVEGRRLRGTTWANLYSPRVDRYDLAFRPEHPGDGPIEALTAWLGLPGDALGGMDPRAAEPSIWRSRYDFSVGLDAMSGVPVQVSSTKSLTGRWEARAGSEMESRLREDERLPVGTITNRLGLPLSECLLAYGSHAYELGELAPGESIEVGPLLRLREFKSLLTDRLLVFDEEKEDYHTEATPYDRGSTDAAYILRAMMFFEAAGGKSYTGLSNRYQGFVDLTDALKTDRAVLIGRARTGSPPHGATLWCNGAPMPESQVRRTTYYRFVLPVEKEGES